MLKSLLFVICVADKDFIFIYFTANNDRLFYFLNQLVGKRVDETIEFRL